MPNYQVPRSKSGVKRTVDYCSQEGGLQALDVLKLNLSKISDIQSRIDAEAYKVQDILSHNGLRFAVLCDFPSDTDARHDVQQRAKLIEREGGGTSREYG